MELILNDQEVRVLGALIEKEITTPDYYPLSLNSLTAACNQTSNRNPVVHYDEQTVAQALDMLREKKLVHMVDRGDSRVTKYRHVLYQTLNMSRPVIAVMCVLMLRGPQTIGEIRTRTSRLYDFTSLEQVETTWNGLMSGESPLITRLPRQSGQKEVRFAISCLVKSNSPSEPEPETETEAEPQFDRIQSSARSRGPEETVRGVQEQFQ